MTADADLLAPSKPQATFEDFKNAYNSNQIAAARTLIDRLSEDNPTDSNARFHQAMVLYVHYLESERPIEILEAVLKRDPGHFQAMQLLSNINLGVGDKEKAADYARRCIAVQPKASIAYLNLVMAEPETGPDLAARIHGILAEGGLSPYHERAFHSALGKIYDRLDETTKAFHHFTEANRRAGGEYAAKALVARLKETKAIFTPEFIAQKARIGSPDPRMVFIVGTPRAGSTLLERMLARHSMIDTAGERSEISALNARLSQLARSQGIDPGFCFGHLRALDSGGARNMANAYLKLIEPAISDPEASWWIDKLPGNFAYVGLIKMLFPNATVLHARRHVLDVALSCYMQSFTSGNEYTNDLGAFAHFWICYAETMIHWQKVMGDEFQTVSYERLVSNPETETRKVLDRIGAPWSEDCLDPSNHERVVTTASVTQVRDPIHKGSIGRWMRYEEQLQPVVKALGGMKAIEKIAALETL